MEIDMLENTKGTIIKVVGVGGAGGNAAAGGAGGAIGAARGVDGLGAATGGAVTCGAACTTTGTGVGGAGIGRGGFSKEHAPSKIRAAPSANLAWPFSMRAFMFIHSQIESEQPGIPAVRAV